MKIRSRAACISAAVAAFACGGSVQARDLTWDYSPGDGVANDGTGSWDLASPNWVDAAAPGVNATWDNTIPDSAIFGGGVSTDGADPNPPYNVNLSANMTVQNLTLADVAGGRFYSVSGFDVGAGASTLTLNGNLLKSGNDGSLNFYLDTILTAGNHTVTMRDTPNDVVEFIYNGVISGSGGLTVDNDTYEAWGTLGLQQNNSYTGVTNINKGRIVVTSNGALGSDAVGSGTTIGEIGTLSLFGAGMEPFGPISVNEPITITRSIYEGGEYDRYKSAITNHNGDNTLSGPITINSTDGRVNVRDKSLTISGNVGGTGTLSVIGENYATVLHLTGNNTMAGGVTILDKVTASVSSHANLGGASAPITFRGDGFLRINGGFMTTFGSHTVNNTTFNGGLDIPTGQTFTVDQNLGAALPTDPAVGAIGKRGGGTLNLNSTIDLRGGQTFWDAGVVNVNGGVTLHSLHLRSPVVNIGTGGSVTTTTGFNAIGQDSTGTNGGPDIAVVNLTGTGQLIQTNGSDFNISDNANTQGTINISDNAVLTTGGITWLGKGTNAVGTVNQHGGTVNINRGGNFGLVLGDGRFSQGPTGRYNLNGGILNVAGEFYVGEGSNAGAPGIGFFTMTGGTVNQNNWFVVAREGGQGTVDISGGTFNKTGGGNLPIGESNKDNVMTLRNNAQFNATTGEFWVANNGGNKATLNVQDTATLSLNNWFVVGRFGANGTLNQSGGTITKAGGGNTEFGVGNGAVSNVTVSGTGVMNINTGELRVGQGGGSNSTLNLQGTGAINTNNWTVIGRGGGTGTLNLSGGTFTKTGGGNFIVAAGGGSNGTFTQIAGTFNNTGSETWINEGGPSGVWNFSGGTANLGRLDVGRNGGGTATLNLSSAAILNATTVRLGEADTVGGVVNQSGGTFTATDVTIRAGTNRAYHLSGGALTVPTMVNNAAFNYTGGAATINTINGTGTTTVGPAVTLTVNQLRQDALVVQGTAKVNTNGGDAGTTVVKSLNVSGKLELNDNDLIVDYTGASVEGQVRQYVINGRMAASTSGIFSTPGNPDDDVVMAVADNAAWGKTIFNGINIDTDTVVGKYTYFGDANLDGKVTGDDYLNVDANLGTGDSWLEGDFNMSGVTTGDDYLAIDANLGKGTTTPLAFAELKEEMVAAHVAMFGEEYLVKLAAVEAEGFGASVVPEPAMFGVIGASAVALLARRRRARKAM